MKEKIKKLWHYVVLIVSVLIILVQSINLLTNLITYNWYGVLIDIVIISLFLYIIWNRFFKKRQPKIKSQKGFIQIPLLIAIIISIVAVSTVTIGVVLYKQGKLASITANISQIFKGAEEIAITEETELKELQTERLKISQEEIVQQEQKSAEKTKPESEIEPIEEETVEPEFIPEVEELEITPEIEEEASQIEQELQPETQPEQEETKNEMVEELTGTEVGGIISSNTTWTKENNPYVISSTVQIPLGVTLTIKPGVIVTKPTSGDMFLVNGTIYAHGVKEDKITFDGGDDSDFFHITGSESAFLDLEYSIVKNGLMFWPGGNHNGHFYLQHSELINLAEQSTIWFPSGNININYNKFVNTYGFRIFTDNDVKVYIKNNLFYKGHSLNNTGYFNFYILVDSQDSSEVTIKYNSFIDMSNIVLKLSDSSINTFSASENYWGTQDKNAIESMIYDRNDDIRPADYVNYLPILKESHSNTPEL